MPKIRIVPTLVILFVAVVVLFGGWMGYRDFGLVGPVEKQLQKNSSVATVSVQVSGMDRKVRVTLKDISDLQTTYSAILSTVHHEMGAQTQLVIEDNRSEELSRLYRSYQPMIYEGLAKADYTNMITDVQKMAQQDGLKNVRITMDDRYLYIQMQQGQAYLYDVISYHDSSALGSQGVTRL